MDITMQKNEAQLALALTGRLDTSTAPQLEKVVNDDLAGVTELVIDCEKLEYISSAGLRVLLKAQKKMGAGNMKLQNVNETIMEVFEITGFCDVLTIE